MPSDKLPAAIRDRYRHLVLADPDFGILRSIDMLIGNNLFPLLLRPKANIIHYY